MTTQLALDPAIVAHLTAVNSFDLDAIMDTFADDALVNDFSREFWGRDHIRAFMTKEFVGDTSPSHPSRSSTTPVCGACAANSTVTTTRPACPIR